MAAINMLEHYKNMCARNIVLDFRGAISHNILVKMAELIKDQFTQKSSQSGMVKKIFSVFIELAQNISYYSSERISLQPDNSEVGAGMIMITENGSDYTITSGNLIKTDEIPALSKHCQKINTMDRDELKEFYKIKIKANREKGKQGANIGLIDIARKSGNPIDYRVIPIDDKNSFLVLSVRIEEEKSEKTTN